MINIQLSSIPRVTSAEVEETRKHYRIDKLAEMVSTRERLIDVFTGEAVSTHLVKYFDGHALRETSIAQHNLVKKAIKRISLVYKDQPSVDFGEDREAPEGYGLIRRW